MTALPQIFLALPHDNNHVLNTGWLFLVGPSAPPLLVRLPAVFFGTLCVPVAARIGAKRHPRAGIFAAALVACDGLLVHYGSEARGYSGLILASLLAIDALETAKQAPERHPAFVCLAAAVAFGTLSQLTMVATSLVVCADAAIAAMRGAPQGCRLFRRIIIALALGTLPAFVCLAVSVVGAQPHTGVQTPFSWLSFADGLARMAEATIGFSDKGGDPAIVVAIVCAACACALALVPPGRRVLPALAIFGVPALQAALHLPNEQFARFHMVSGLGLILLSIEVFAHLAAREMVGRRPRAFVACLFASFVLLLHAPNLVLLLAEGRGTFAEPVALMGADGGADGPATFTVRPTRLLGETNAVVAWYAGKSGAAVASERSACPAQARWLVVVREPGESLRAGDQRVEGPDGCRGFYALRRAYGSYGLSGFTWLLFRREDAR